MTDQQPLRDIAIGMVDALDSTGFGPSEGEIEFARAYMTPGPMDPVIMARLFDPALLAEREQITIDRRNRDWPAISQYRDANAALAGRPVDVVFIGDSLTEFWTAAQPEFFTGGIVNRGVSGQTSPQILIRFMPDVVALKPKVVHLLCGANDIAGNTGPTTPQDYRNNILAMLALARAHGIKVVLGGLTPFRDVPWNHKIADCRPRIAELNAWLTALAAEQGLVHADYFPVLADADGAMRAAFTRDGVHPGLEGYAAMRPVADAALAKALS
jgi:lysophospholipase L1-like esterase